MSAMKNQVALVAQSTVNEVERVEKLNGELKKESRKINKQKKEADEELEKLKRRKAEVEQRKNDLIDEIKHKRSVKEKIENQLKSLNLVSDPEDADFESQIKRLQDEMSAAITKEKKRMAVAIECFKQDNKDGSTQTTDLPIENQELKDTVHRCLRAVREHELKTEKRRKENASRDASGSGKRQKSTEQYEKELKKLREQLKKAKQKTVEPKNKSPAKSPSKSTSKKRKSEAKETSNSKRPARKSESRRHVDSEDSD